MKTIHVLTYTHALSLALTRVASVQLSRGFSNIVHQWFGHTQGHHTISHLDGDNRTQLLQIDQWYAEQFAYLVSALDSVQEGDGTLLDNTLVGNIDTDTGPLAGIG